MPYQITPPPPPGWGTWEKLMELALDEARQAAAQGEVPVGAVVVTPAGSIVGKGHNSPLTACDPTAHAEILALRAAASKLGNYRLDGCFLVVNLEPCLMCAGALVHARCAGLIYGAADLKAGVIHSCAESLEEPFLNHRVWHMGGVCAAQSTELLQTFFTSCRQTKKK